LSTALKIEIFSDPACPWCLLGLHRLDRALETLPAAVRAQIIHYPYFLDPAAPVEGEDVAEMLRRKYGRDPGEMWDRLEAEAAKSGIALDMRKQTQRYATQRAQSLIAAAAQKGTQHALARAIGDAYYLEGRNIADPEVLVPLAMQHGFSDEEARSVLGDAALKSRLEGLAADASAQGVRGVPFFVVGQAYALSGAQPEAVFVETLQAALLRSGSA